MNRTLLIGMTILSVAILASRYFVQKYTKPKLRITSLDFAKDETNKLKDGDIIFQTSTSAQSRAIQLATHSKYSHCGLIYKNGTNCFVYEAVQPVKLTPLQLWITRGEGGHYVVKRLKDANLVLKQEVIDKMKVIAGNYTGKDYDTYFGWNDERIYCSELVWKVYKQGTGLEVGELQRLKDFDLSNATVKQKMKERYGNKVPMDEIVISPESIFQSDKLVTVEER